MPDAPRLVIAGAATPDSAPWMRRLQQAPLAGHVDHVGYVPEGERERLYAGARALVMPSLDEGFGVPALEAMAAGVPVIAAESWRAAGSDRSRGNTARPRGRRGICGGDGPGRARPGLGDWHKAPPG